MNHEHQKIIPDNNLKNSETTYGNGGGSDGTTSNANNNTRACAACKYQRRRCAAGCPLAPYFPPDHQKQFLNAHKLFGLRNMMKVYKKVKHDERDVAMRSMILEADIRAQDPVGGCHRIIQQLQKQIQLCNAELGFVHNELALVQNLNINGLLARRSSGHNKAASSSTQAGDCGYEFGGTADFFQFQAALFGTGSEPEPAEVPKKFDSLSDEAQKKGKTKLDIDQRRDERGGARYEGQTSLICPKIPKF